MQFLPLVKTSFEDLIGKKQPVRDSEAHLKAALDWLKYAQDITGDGGVSSWYNFINNWDCSFIETTGYILETFLHSWDYFKDPELKLRALKMADFILSMQLENGGYRTYPPERSLESEPTIFNTGQDLLGMTEVYKYTKIKKYLNSAIKAADFLCSVQEKDGSWIRYEYDSQARTYETRTAWALIKTYKITANKRYLNCAKKNLKWAAKNQRANGWFDLNTLPNSKNPITHTISYSNEGFLFSGIEMNNKEWIHIAEEGVKPILKIVERQNFIPGSFDEDWTSKDNYSCLTGDAQLAFVWLKLFKITNDSRYLQAAKKMNSYLKSTQNINTKNRNIQGGIKGSSPLYGDILALGGYCRLSYLNWATKFFADSLLEEITIS